MVNAVSSCVQFQVMHHWDNVHKPLIGDFLHCGGKQLLLLFGNGMLVQQPHAGYLLTDLQGFVLDRRESGGRHLSASKTQEEDARGNLQGVITALREQSQVI